MNIHVHIEQVSVDGVDIGPFASVDLQVALQNRLTELLVQRGLPSDVSKTAWIAKTEAPALSVTRRLDGATLGSRIAESLHSGFESHNTRPGTHGSIARG